MIDDYVCVEESELKGSFECTAVDCMESNSLCYMYIFRTKNYVKLPMISGFRNFDFIY